MIKQYWLMFVVISMLNATGFSQEQYSYMTDRIFKDQLDLFGYNFVPNQMEIPQESQEDLKMGEYTFGILGSNLYIDGGDIKGVYSINNIDPADYGFKLNLMNARDPTIQGHLKIIQTKYGHVDALVFKRSTKDKEIIFFLPQIPKNLRQRERDYFTDRWELPLKDIDELWGQTVRPFLRIHDDQSIQERLQLNDSTSITFVEKITKEEKKKRGRKKKKKIEMENIELGLPDNEEVTEEVVIEEEPEPEPEPESKVEEKVAPKPKTNARSSRKRQRFGGYQNTRSYDDVEEEEEEEEVVVAPEPKVAPKPKEEAVKKEITKDPVEVAEKMTSGASPEEDGKEYKIIKEYFVNLRTILTYDDGTTEDVSKSYPVKKIIEREDDLAGPDAERFQLEITLKRGRPLYLYLTSDRTISSMEVDGKTYLMRGH